MRLAVAMRLAPALRGEAHGVWPDLPAQHSMQHIFGDRDLVLEDIADAATRLQRIEVDAVEPGARNMQQGERRRAARTFEPNADDDIVRRDLLIERGRGGRLARQARDLNARNKRLEHRLLARRIADQDDLHDALSPSPNGGRPKSDGKRRCRKAMTFPFP